MHRLLVGVKRDAHGRGCLPARLVGNGGQQDQWDSRVRKVDEGGDGQAMKSFGHEDGVDLLAPNALHQLIGREAALHHDHLARLDESGKKVPLSLRVAEADRES